MVGLIIYCVGAILAFGLMYALAIDLSDKKEVGMVVIGTLLSWLTVVFIIYKDYRESKRNRKKSSSLTVIMSENIK